MTVMTMVVMTVPTCLSVCLSVCLPVCLSVRCRAWTWTTTSRWTARAAGSERTAAACDGLRHCYCCRCVHDGVGWASCCAVWG